MLGRVTILLIATIPIAGCQGRVLDDLVVSESHPANPAASTGQPLRVSRALQPEFEDVQPLLQRNPAIKRPVPPTSGDGGRHRH